MIFCLLTILRYILEKDFPGMRIGPEPTTDTFHVVDYAGGVGLATIRIKENRLLPMYNQHLVAPFV